MLNELFSVENLLHLDQRILVVICSLLLLSLIFFGLSAKRFMRGKPVTASF